MRLITFILLFYTLLSEMVFGQILEPKERFDVKELPQVRASDVMWHRRLWREIDLKEKINQHLYFPNEKEERNYCLFDLLYYYLTKGSIKAYSVDNDDFKTELSLKDIETIVYDTIELNNMKIAEKIDGKDVVKLWLKEDWFYNSKYSRIEVRIIGVCPVRIRKDSKGDILGYQQMFWLYFPHIRSVLVNYEAIKKQKETDSRVSFDDVFVKHRMFNSYIILNKVDKLQQIRESKTELDIKLENEKTKIYQFNSNFDIWQ